LIKACPRGFYGLTYKAIDGRGKLFAIKLISKLCYKQYGKDFDQEVNIYAKLPNHPCIASYISSGEVTVPFPNNHIDFYFIQSEWIEGDTLKNWMSTKPLSVVDLQTAATDLLSALEAINEKQLWHNDLHAENILVTELSEAERLVFRRDVPLLFKIVDIGSMKYKSPGAVKEIGDLAYIGRHLTEFTSRIMKRITDLSKEDQSFIHAFSGILNRLSDEHPSRNFESPKEALIMINNLYRQSRYEDIAVKQNLKDPYGLINANDIHSPFLILQMFSPGYGYFKKIVSMDHQCLVISGPRGCGKTMILKYMRFITQFDGNELKDKGFLTSINYIGLFVSARFQFGNYLLAARLPEWINDQNKVGLYFNILVSLELIDVLYRLDAHQLEDSANIQIIVDYIIERFKLKSHSLLSIKSELIVIAQSIILEEGHPLPTTTLNSTPAYIHELGKLFLQGLPSMRGKTLVLLIDDLSWPRIPDSIMMTLAPSLFNTGASYKTRVSAHPDGLVTRDHAGEQYKPNRDFTEINLGREYVLLSENYQVCLNAFNDIMEKRFNLAKAGGFPGIETILGKGEKLSEIGKIIRQLKLEGKLRSLIYHGSHVFIRLCSGDLSYLVEILGTMATRWGKEEYPIGKKIQHDVIRNYARHDLRMLRDITTQFMPSLYEVGLYFGLWSKQKLIENGDEYLRIEIVIEDSNYELFGAMRELLAYGLFIDWEYSNNRDGKPCRRLLFRRIYTPAFPTTFNSRNTFPMSARGFLRFVKNPKNYVLERWSENGIKPDEQHRLEQLEMFDD